MEVLANAMGVIILHNVTCQLISIKKYPGREHGRCTSLFQTAPSAERSSSGRLENLGHSNNYNRSSAENTKNLCPPKIYIYEIFMYLFVYVKFASGHQRDTKVERTEEVKS